MQLRGLILAGGGARRMGGGDKPLLRLGDGCVLDQVVGRLAPQVAELALSANGDPARFAPWDLHVVADEVAGQGPLAGILAGLRWAAPSLFLLSVPGDTPFLPLDLADRLAQAQHETGRPIVHAASAGRDHPTVALIATALADDLAAALASGVRAIRRWMATHSPAFVEFDAGGGDPFMNLNRPEDLHQAELRLRTLRL